MSSPTLVQYADTTNLSVAFPSPVTAGNFLVCLGSAVGGVSDTLGNIWVLFQEAFVFDLNLSVYVCASSKGGANTASTSAGSGFLAVAEFSPSVIQSQASLVTGGMSADFAGAVNQLLVGQCVAFVGGNSITGVGAGFTQASGSFESRIGLEYQELASSGSVSSDFTITGTASRVGTSAFTLSTTPTPLAGTPSIVQAARINFENNVTKGNSILVVAFPFTSTNTPALACNDTLGNVYVPITSSAVNGFGVNGPYCFASFFFCAASVASGANIVSLSGPSINISETWLLELSPCSVAAFSPMASGTVTGADITSGAISALAGQLLIDFAVTADDSANSSIGMPCAGFQAPLNPLGNVINSFWFTLATQPVVANGSYNSDFNVYATAGSFSGPYATGIIALASTYSISGNAGVAGATVAYSGTSSGSVVADGSGNYSIIGLAPGSYTLTPSKTGYDFFPTSQNETITTSNLTGVNFTSSSLYNVSGNAGAAGATVSYSGTVSGSVTADGSGNFSISLPNGTYTITPSVPGRTFTPGSRSETVSGAPIANVNFTENPLGFSAIGFSPSFVARNEGGLRIWVATGIANGVKVNGQFVTVFANTMTYVWVDSTGQIWPGLAVPPSVYAIAQVVASQIQVSGTGNPNSGAYVLADGIISIQDLRTS